MRPPVEVRNTTLLRPAPGGECRPSNKAARWTEVELVGEAIRPLDHFGLRPVEAEMRQPVELRSTTLLRPARFAM